MTSASASPAPVRSSRLRGSTLAACVLAHALAVDASAAAPATAPAGHAALPDGVRVEADLLQHDATASAPLAWQGRVRVEGGSARLLADALRFDPVGARFLGARIEVQPLPPEAAAGAITLACDGRGGLVADGDGAPAPDALGDWRFRCVDGEVAASLAAAARP